MRARYLSTLGMRFALLGALAVSLGVGPMASPSPVWAQGMQPLQGYVVTVPAGTYVMGSVQSGVSSESARAGDRVAVSVNSPVMSGGSVALPAGTLVEGQVVSVTSAGRAGRNGQIDIRFTSAMLPTGQRVPISARIQTEDGTGILKGGTAKGRAGKAALKTGGGAAVGAALGTAMGPLSGGGVGRGAIYGTALGAGLGALYAGASKGEEINLNPGEAINIVLDAPVTTSAASNAGMAQPQPYGQTYNTQQYSTQSYGTQQPYGTQPQYGTQPNYYSQPATDTNYGYNQQAQPVQQQTPYYGGNTTNTYGY